MNYNKNKLWLTENRFPFFTTINKICTDINYDTPGKYVLSKGKRHEFKLKKVNRVCMTDWLVFNANFSSVSGNCICSVKKGSTLSFHIVNILFLTKFDVISPIMSWSLTHYSRPSLSQLYIYVVYKLWFCTCYNMYKIIVHVITWTMQKYKL